MKRKCFYVVTQTYVDFIDQSVEVFIIGISEELDGAKSILNSIYEKKLKNGYYKDHFEINLWEWVYKSDCWMIKSEIHTKYV